MGFGRYLSSLRRVQVNYKSLLRCCILRRLLCRVPETDVLFSLFGRRLLELGSPGDKNVRYLAGLPRWIPELAMVIHVLALRWLNALLGFAG